MNLSDRSPKSGNIKAALLIAAFVIIIPILIYTHNLVDRLQQKEREVAALYAKSVEYLANSPFSGAEYNFIFDELIRAIDFPIIESDAGNFEIKASRNIDVDTTLPKAERDAYVRSLIPEMDRINRPIVVSYQDTIILSRVHYGESPLVTRLRWLPYIEIVIASLFIFVGYIGFSYIKRSEQSNIWVGMARETAHQLGTPLSSMMGWTEILKLRPEADAKTAETIAEMENDLHRLNKIADRFSKIGSRPDLREEDLGEVVKSVISYFQKRIPQMGKRVDIVVEPSEPVEAKINRELFEWVLENLVKNGLDAMEDGKGKISFRISRAGNAPVIDVTDTGKGIDAAYRKDVFRPGFSTKKRGWGLGLSLSKRIVETYHKGKLSIKESKLGVGTTFRIKLRG
ncbi:MAG TPA: HAMP domain-containing sensor histidine kinase [Bacteroidota bacterium]|nr:HAMP domain-containing sensor histidine kinase [Bacteroidota bacterium]